MFGQPPGENFRRETWFSVTSVIRKFFVGVGSFVLFNFAPLSNDDQLLTVQMQPHSSLLSPVTQLIKQVPKQTCQKGRTGPSCQYFQISRIVLFPMKLAAKRKLQLIDSRSTESESGFDILKSQSFDQILTESTNFQICSNDEKFIKC